LIYPERRKRFPSLLSGMTLIRWLFFLSSSDDFHVEKPPLLKFDALLFASTIGFLKE